MGCFSFICNECKKPVNSDSFQGEMVKLFLLQDGKVIQEMEGEYDSYGRVFIDGTQDKTVKHALRKSVQWDCPELHAIVKAEKDPNQAEFYKKDLGTGLWHAVCDLMSKGEGVRTGKPFPDVTELTTLEERLNAIREYFERDEEDDGKIYYLKGHEPKPGNGIAAIHSKCFKQIPTVQSQHDPNQGWGTIRKKHQNPNKSVFIQKVQ